MSAVVKVDNSTAAKREIWRNFEAKITSLFNNGGRYQMDRRVKAEMLIAVSRTPGKEQNSHTRKSETLFYYWVEGIIEK